MPRRGSGLATGVGAGSAGDASGRRCHRRRDGRRRDSVAGDDRCGRGDRSVVRASGVVRSRSNRGRALWSVMAIELVARDVDAEAARSAGRPRRGDRCARRGGRRGWRCRALLRIRPQLVSHAMAAFVARRIRRGASGSVALPLSTFAGAHGASRNDSGGERHFHLSGWARYGERPGARHCGRRDRRSRSSPRPRALSRIAFTAAPPRRTGSRCSRRLESK